jgi:hypothetical protein
MFQHQPGQKAPEPVPIDPEPVPINPEPVPMKSRAVFTLDPKIPRLSPCRIPHFL